MHSALPVCDAAVVVCEADPRKIPALQVILRELEELGLPRILFLNKIDQADGSLRETLEMLQPASRTPLLLRQIPVWEDGVATGFVDLALERAFVYREAAPSSVIEMPRGRDPGGKAGALFMLEKLADYDDALMEQLISDIDPPKDLVFDDLARELREGHVVPVLMGSATGGHGVTRLLKAVRHEAPASATPASGSASTIKARLWRRSSAPSTPPTAASCRWRACCAASSPTGRRSSIRAGSRSASAASRG